MKAISLITIFLLFIHVSVKNELKEKKTSVGTGYHLKPVSVKNELKVRLGKRVTADVEVRYQ